MTSSERRPSVAGSDWRSTDALGRSFFASLSDSASEGQSFCRILDLGDSTNPSGWPRDLTQRHSVARAASARADAMHLRENEVILSYNCAPAYELSAILAAVRDQDSPFPDDCALEIALALTAALASPFDACKEPSEPWHGFLVPHLVLVSASGEVRPVAWEVGPTLARAHPSRAAPGKLSSYRSPEVGDGCEPDASDDVFSLGAMLTHLLTGVDPAVFGTDPPPSLSDGRRMPENLHALLEKSMRSRSERFIDIREWHRALQVVVFERHFRATAESVGHLVWSLCDGVAGVSAADSTVADFDPLPPSPSVDAETVDLPALHAELEEIFEPAQSVSAAAVEAPAGAAESQSPVLRSGGRRSLSKLTGLKLTALGLASLGVVSILAFLAFLRWGQDSPITSTPRPRPTTGLSEPPAGDRAASPSLALDAAASEVRETGSDAAVPNAQEQQPEQRHRRDEQLDAPPVVAEPLERTEPPASAGLGPKTVPPSRVAPPRDAVVVQRDSIPSARASERDGSASAESQRGPAATLAAGATPPPAQTSPVDRLLEPSASTASAPSGSTDPRPGPRPVSPAAAPAAKVGDLVELGPGVTPPQLVEPPTPRFPKRARRVNKRGTITIGVLVDETGRVVSTELRSEPVGYKLDEAALEAALQARYVPARKDDVPVKTWTTIRFVFRLD